MKKHLSLILFLSILVSGCSQEELSRNESVNGRTFTASFEQNESRTYIEDSKHLRWTTGDLISLFNSNTLNQQYKFDGKTGDNSGTFSKVETVFGTGNDLNCHYAVYPYASDITITESGVITVTLPAEQVYVENSFGLGANTMVAVTEDTDDTFLKFKNVGGYLKLQLYGDNVTVKSITLTGNNNEKLAGAATITSVYGQDPTINMADDATGSVTLDCGEGVEIGSTAETATDFWIVVPPTTFENGFEVTITDVNDNEVAKSTSNEISIARNTIKPMPAFEVEIETIPNNQIWYTLSDGSLLTPNESANFGANIISNVNENGKGIITFDGEVTIIGQRSFSNCTSLTSITIPNSVTTIGYSAFEYCSSLTSITIPKSVSNIGEAVFSFCESLSSIIVEEGNEVYDSRENCNALIETASNKLIQGSNNTTIPFNIKTIGNGAFACTSFTNIVIPNGVVTIGDMAFAYCRSLSTITIPNSVETIGNMAFAYCNSLSDITFPNSVTSIGFSVFDSCYQHISIKVNAKIPPAISQNTFKEGAVISVPWDSIETYKLTDYWKNLNLITF